MCVQLEGSAFVLAGAADDEEVPRGQRLAHQVGVLLRRVLWRRLGQAPPDPEAPSSPAELAALLDEALLAL